MKDNQFKDTVPTVGLNVEQITYRGHNFTLWDVSGQATRLWKHYFDKINAIIFVVDSTDPGRLAKVKQQLVKVCNDKELGDAPILLFANKQDATDNDNLMTPDQLYDKLGLEDIKLNMVESGNNR